MPEVTTIVKEVQEEIKKIGAHSKENYEQLRKNFEELKASTDPEKLDKLASDIVTRQEAIDKKVNERMDSLEVMMQKIPYSASEKTDQLFQEAKSFYVAVASGRSKEKGLKLQALKEVEKNINVEEFIGYKSVFEKYIRNNGDERSLSPSEYKLLQVGIDTDGGYTVTPFMASRITQRLYEMDPIRQLASIQPITTESYEELVDWGDAGAEWESETVASTDTTTPQLNKKKITTHSLGTRPKVTQQLLEDSSINIESWLSDKIANRFARTEGSTFITGNGVGKPRGILTYGTGTTFGTVEQVNMGHASQLTADGFISIKYSLKEFFIERGTWLMNRTTLMAAMKLKDGNGDYLWKPGLLANDPSSSLLGLPVRMSTTMPAVTNNSLSVALADWARAYMIIDRIGITVLRDPYTAKPNIEFYTRKRVGADIVDFDAIKIGKIAA